MARLPTGPTRRSALEAGRLAAVPSLASGFADELIKEL
jgi:hypothetical protein